MEIQNNQINNLNKQKSRFRKFILAFFVVIIGAFVLFIMVAWGWQKYRYWQDEKIAQKAEEGIRKWQQEDYERAMADTYGGKTPQETLQMYIDAVEKGDYELASRYFIGEYQEKELRSFDGATEKGIENILNVLKKVKLIDSRAKLAEMYDEENKKHNLSESKEEYINRLYEVWDYDKKAWMDTRVDGYYFSVSFKKYPNNIWKIIEI